MWDALEPSIQGTLEYHSFLPDITLIFLWMILKSAGSRTVRLLYSFRYQGGEILYARCVKKKKPTPGARKSKQKEKKEETN